MNDFISTTSLSGNLELLEAVRRLEQPGGEQQHLETATLDAVLTAPRQGAIAQQAEMDTPVRFFHPVFVAETRRPLRHTLQGRSVIVLHHPGDSLPVIEGWAAWPVALGNARVAPEVVVRPYAEPVPLIDALRALSTPPDAILLVMDAARWPVESLLGNDLEAIQTLLNALFLACKEAYDPIRSGTTRVAAVTCRAFSADGVLNPIAGLFGGFIKSLARELPESHVAALHTDSELENLLDLAEQALAPRPTGTLPEISLRGKLASRAQLAPTSALTRAMSQAVMREGMVVLATGGARGVTAVLLEELVTRYRCKVVALGRTRLDATPQALLAMSEDELAAHEADFYRNALAEHGGGSIVKLKAEFRKHVAANEIFQNQRRFEALGGELEYLVADITREEEVDLAMRHVLARYQTVDLIVHGAGLQISRTMPGKSVADFDSIVTAKLTGLRNIYVALAREGLAGHTQFHLVSSAFSFWGNEGQQDYGAANEAMNRLAAAMTATGGRWTSLAWPGWAGIGMTRGSEYASLARTRDLYPVTKQEGAHLFTRLMQECPTHAANILASPKEIKFYSVPVAAESPSLGENVVEPIELSLDRASYLTHHLVGGIPTMPGAVELMHAIRAATRGTPNAKGAQVRNARFVSFLKSYPGRANRAHVIVESALGNAASRVSIQSDFIHPSGRVLREDVLNFEGQVLPVMHRPTASQEMMELAHKHSGSRIPDPYVKSMGNVRLSGVFDCLRDIVIGEAGQTAWFDMSAELREDPNTSVLAPAVLLDALWRLAVIRPVDGAVALRVPVTSRKLTLWWGDGEGVSRLQGARLAASRPVPLDTSKGTVIIHHAVAFDASGNVLATNQDIVAQSAF